MGTTLADRINWILANCVAPDGSKWTAKGLGVAAGLKSPAHVGMLARGDAGKRTAGETLERIARTAGVSLTWLTTGAGTPDLIDPPSAADAGTRPRFDALPNWAALRATAEALDPSLPAWALDEVEVSHPLATAPITAHQVVKLARLAMELLPPPDDEPPAPTKGTKGR